MSRRALLAALLATVLTTSCNSGDCPQQPEPRFRVTTLSLEDGRVIEDREIAFTSSWDKQLGPPAPLAVLPVELRGTRVVTDRNAVLHGVRADNGTPRWDLPGLRVVAHTVSSGVLLGRSGGPPRELVAVDVLEGRLLWRTPLPRNDRFELVVSGQTVLLSTPAEDDEGRASTSAHRLKTGDVLWTREAGLASVGALRTRSDVVVLGTSDRVYSCE